MKIFISIRECDFNEPFRNPRLISLRFHKMKRYLYMSVNGMYVEISICVIFRCIKICTKFDFTVVEFDSLSGTRIAVTLLFDCLIFPSLR